MSFRCWLSHTRRVLGTSILFVFIGALFMPTGGVAQSQSPDGTLPADWVKALKWRSIGPAGMGGRITDIAVYEADPCVYWIATASGGLLKTTNNGTTFEHQFDREGSVSVGAVTVAPSDRNVVWVGTGENNPRNSVSYGDGVYKSIDGGKTWKHMGLKKSYQVGRIVIHPKDPNTVYVGALGRLWGPNEERGLFKTTDGGATWKKVLFVDDKTGVIDLVMHPTDANTFIVAMWERQRDEFDSHRGEPPLQDGYDSYDPIKKWGPGSGIFKTTDGGKSFKRMTKGLPSNPVGRIGLSWYRKDPKVVWAIIDCEKIAMGTPPSRAYMGVQGEDSEIGVRVTLPTPNGPAAKAGLKREDLIRTLDKKPVTKLQEITDAMRLKKVGDKVVAEIMREDKTMEITITLEDRPAGQLGPGQQQPSVFQLLGAATEDVEGGGVKILRVFEERAADNAGLGENDIIKEADKKPVADGQALLDALRAKKEGEKIVIKFVREDETKEATLEIPGASATTGPGSSQAMKNRPYTFMYGGQQANAHDQQGPNSHEYGGVYRSADSGESWTRVNSLNPRPMYFSLIRVDPSDEKYVYLGGVSLHRSSDGGKTFTADGGRTVHSDHHALWVDARDGRHMIVGGDGGVYVTYDRMENWDHHNHAAIGQFYHVATDTRQPYWVYGGLQDNGSWGGPSRSLRGGGTFNEDWISTAGGDGYVSRVDQTDPDIVYAESQDGGMTRYNLRTGQRFAIRPRPVPGVRFRFNWNTPYILSHHNQRILYAAGNYVFKSVKQGEDLRIISPVIARTGRGTGTALSESPRNQDVVWCGTDDGNLWLTKDGGKTWTNLADKVGLKQPLWVSTIEASRFVEGRAYVAFDAHRSDDDEPYLYVTEDFGKTWKSIRANLPVGSSRCLREDVTNPNLLYVGTEFACFASLNRGVSWTKLNNNLPTVPVFDIAVHPTAGEIVAATHGRSLWVLDVTSLRQMGAACLAAPVTLYQPAPAIRWRSEPSRSTGSGNRKYFAESPQPGANVFYSITKKSYYVKLRIEDVNGKVVRELDGDGEVGLHALTWDLRSVAQRPGGGGGRFGGGGGGGGGGARGAGGAGGGAGGTGGGAGGGGGGAAGAGGPGAGGGPFGFGGAFGTPVAAGTYKIILSVDGEEFTQTVKVENDPTVAPASAAPVAR